MKSKHLLLMLLLALMAPWAAQAQQCEISYNLTDSYGDGWNGGSMVVTDATTSTQLASLTISSGSSLVGTIPVTSGHEITFSYTAGSYAYENSWVFTDIAGTTIWEGSGDGGSQSYTYTAECPSCFPPSDITVTLTPGQGTIATFSWSSDATAWQICFNNDESNLFDVNRPSFTYNGFTPETQYTVKVRTNCDGQYSSWSSPVTFTPTNAYQITVNDGTTTNGYVPIYGYYVDSNTKSQFIIPANVLDNMAYGTITQLTFYASQSSINWGNATFEVYMSETAETTVSTLVDWSTMTKVRNAASLSIVNNMMVVVFDTPYEYQGGNLMIGFNQPTTGTYVTSNWYGVSATGASIGGYGNSVSQQNFLPKTTFNYVPAAASDCETPTSIAVSDVTSDGAIVAWEGEGSAWNLRYKASTDADFTLVEGLTAQTYSLNRLASNTSYSVGVQTVCSGSTSNFKSTTFTTANPCAAPTNLQITNITAESATLTWTPGYQETTWTVKYKKSTETDYTSTTVSGTPSINLTGLDGCTQYNVQIYNCESYLSGNFVTAAGIPFTESFATTSAPAGWTRYTGLLSDVMSGTALTTTTSGWNFNTGNGVFDNHARVNIYSTNCKYWLVAPTLTMENNVQLTFDLALTKYSGTLQPVDPTQQTDDKFVVLITTNGGATWEILRQWDNESSNYVYNEIACSAVGETVAIDLSSYAGQDIAVAFYGESTVSGGDNNLHIDNVSIDYIPDCAKPTGLAKANETAHTVDLSWTSDAEAWVVAYKAANDADFTEVNVTENPYTLTGLLPETAYTAKVKTNCDGIYSEYSNTISFTTTVACPAPTALTVTPNFLSATFTWESFAGEWEVAFAADADAEPEENIVGTVNEATYTVNDLELGDYYFWVRANCGDLDGDSQWAGPASVHIGYCVPAPTSVDNNGISNVTFGMDDYIVNNDTPKATYADFTSQIGAVQAGVEATIAITFKTGYTYNTYVWVDLDNSLSFDSDEVVCYGESTSSNPTTLTLNFTIPATQTLGDFRMRIGSADSGLGGDPTAANPCYSSSYGCFQDYTLRVLEAPSCLIPTDLAINYTGGTEATISWTSDAEAWNMRVNGVEVNSVITNPYTLTGLDLATTYNVEVQANCGEDQSEWTAPVSFTTDLCMPENQCQITITVTDAYGDGGGEIVVIDNATEEVLGTYTNLEASTTYTLNVCEGRELSFVFNSTDNWSYENGWVITDVNDEIISEHEGCQSSGSCEDPTEGVIATYTVNCTVITCKKPKDLAAFDIDKTSVVLSWTPGSEDQSAWRIAYMSENDSTYNYKNVTSNSYTLNGLTPETTYTVKVQANCGDGDYSNWSDEISFTTAEACPAEISGFSTSNVTPFNAQLSWTGEYNGYQVRYKKVTGETEWTTVATNSSSIALYDLEPSTNYVYQVRGYCPDVDAFTDPVPVDGIYFSTAGVCSAPENLLVVPSIETAALSWTGYQTSYTVTWGNNDGIIGNENTEGTNFTLTDLQPSTTYTATVTGQGDCLVAETASIEFTTGTGWSDPEAWSEPGTIADSTIVVIEPGQIIEIEDLNVGDGSYIVIEPGAELIFGGEEPIPVVISFDDEEEEPKPAKCRDAQTYGKYRLIAPPTFIIDPITDERYLPVDTTHLMDNYYENDLYSFDQSYPAAEWRNYKLAENNFVNLNWKQGYLYAYVNATGTWPGYAAPTANASQVIDLVYDAEHANLPGANLIGNPFIVKGYPSMPFYVLNKEGDEVIADTTHYVKAGKGFFVLATEPGQSCTVSTTAPATVQTLGITLRQDCSKIDVAAIHFNDTRDLAKFQLNPNHTKIYMPFEGKDYAILHGEALGEMPLNFEAEESGTYTLSFKHSEVEFSYLRLIDNLTGVETNLLVNPEYTFDARVNDYASRFRLVYATGSSIDGDNFSFINSNGNLCIYGIDGIATLQVMDVLGHIISSEKFSGSYEQKLNAAPGVYMLRLINGNDVKVQKIMVK